jgi:hypothetical protein
MAKKNKRREPKSVDVTPATLKLLRAESGVAVMARIRRENRRLGRQGIQNTAIVLQTLVGALHAANYMLKQNGVSERSRERAARRGVKYLPICLAQARKLRAALTAGNGQEN